MPVSAKKRYGTPPVQVRLTESYLAKLDYLTQRLEAAREHPTNRADVFRDLIDRDYSRQKALENKGGK